MSLLVFEFYLKVLGGKFVKDVTSLRGDPELANVIVEFHVQVILMFSKTAHHLKSHNNQITRICWTPSRVFYRELLDFAKSKGILKKQIVLDPGMVFSVVQQNTALCSSGEFQNCMNLIRLCYLGLPEFFSYRRLWGAS